MKLLELLQCENTPLQDVGTPLALRPETPTPNEPVNNRWDILTNNDQSASPLTLPEANPNFSLQEYTDPTFIENLPDSKTGLVIIFLIFC